MNEFSCENLARLAKEFQIASGLKTDVHIELLEKIKEYPEVVAVKIYNYFLTLETNPSILLYLVKTIASYNQESSIEILIELLLWKEKFSASGKNPDDYIELRGYIARVLGYTKNTKVTLPLLYTLNNKNENYKLRLSCADALGQMGSNYAVGSLITVVSDNDEKSVYLRETAAKALGKLRDYRAIEPLVSILEGKEGFVNKFSFFKERIVEALGNIGSKDNRSIKALKGALLDESPYVRLSAIEALSKTDDEQVIPLIKECLFDENAEVAKSSVIALYNMQGKEILTEILDTENIPFICKEEAKAIFDEYENDTEEEEYV
jgi:HEAT repeat protein